VKRTNPLVVALGSFSLCGLSGAPGAPGEPGRAATGPRVEFVVPEEDAAFGGQLERYVDEARGVVTAFFDEAFPRGFTVRVAESRAAFDKFFREKWQVAKTECWWVAAGVANELIMLSPRVWVKEACEHDGTDSAHVKGIVFHELVHVFHGQHNPKVEELEEIGWFVEGLAVYVSGQLDNEHRDAARECINAATAPTQLAKAWSGPYRYGVSGSLVKYVDRTFGRKLLTELLSVQSQDELLGRLKLTEPELLSAWRKFALSPDQEKDEGAARD
jgi:hypothetical protein